MPLALISVSDKTGIVSFAQRLIDLGWSILSTGGTAKVLREAGIKVTDVSEYTGFPEMMGGRLKTLHPFIHGGILNRRDIQGDQDSMLEHGIEPIDAVVVNLYPFSQTVARPAVSFEEAVEQIDIGGPAMLRSAAKNHSSVIPVVDSSDYAAVLSAIGLRNLPEELRLRLATKVFRHTSDYDWAIAHYFKKAHDKLVHQH
jgi:phosphoribosylaminoimidazolecarboxamide formyltransferase / IMP cyclohydrolase